MGLHIEEHDLGERVEAYYTEDPRPALMAINRGLSYQIQQARAIEGCGYYAKPLKNSRRVCTARESFDWVDNTSVEAIRAVVEEHVTPEGIKTIERAYLASENGDAFWIGFDLHTHPYIIIAVLRNLSERGELPAHPSWW